jgi:hypothetical protein
MKKVVKLCPVCLTENTGGTLTVPNLVIRSVGTATLTQVNSITSLLAANDLLGRPL